MKGFHQLNNRQLKKLENDLQAIESKAYKHLKFIRQWNKYKRQIENEQHTRTIR